MSKVGTEEGGREREKRKEEISKMFAVSTFLKKKVAMVALIVHD
jgi:hypothetical protein